jgi:hypothetical protein
MSIIILVIYIVAGIKYGNWSKFDHFYPTILYFVIGDLLSQFLLFNHSLWLFHPMDKIDRLFYLNHTFIALSKMAIQYSVTVAIFIGRLPDTLIKQVLWVFFWTGIYGLNELITHLYGSLTYHRGWNFGWDIVFNIIMFTLLIIHYKRPLFAWALSVPIIVTLWLIFDVPADVIK